MNSYKTRIDYVTDYVNRHLDRNLSLEELAQVSGFSAFHFHRIFSSVTRESVHFFTNRLRLEKAARLIRFSHNSLTSIALECGFSSSSTFSRSFKAYFGISPSEYKKSGKIENSKICKELFPMNEYILPLTETEMADMFPVNICDIPERRVAFVRVVGFNENEKVKKAFETLVSLAAKHGFYRQAIFFGMSLDDPFVTPAEKYRYEACVTLPEDLALDEGIGVSLMTIPAMKYAVIRVKGDIKLVATAMHFFYEVWLLQSRFEPEHQPGMEVFLDKTKIFNWDHFSLDLCLPVTDLKHF